MELIFIGSLFPKDRINEICKNSKCGIDNAANNFQWTLIQGLDMFLKKMSIITMPNIRTYPKCFTKLFFNSSKFSHRNESVDYCLGFINFPLIKHFHKVLTLFNVLKKNYISKDDIYIIVYSLHSPFLLAAIRFKKRNPNAKICLVIPDLPDFMTESKNIFYLFFKKIDSLLMMHLLLNIDSFVVLSDQMVNKLNISNKPWVRIEGIYNNNLNCNKIIENDFKLNRNKKIILYTGTLDIRYGIIDLLDAFTEINNENFLLWICGDGNSKNRIIEASKSDSRIKYYGVLPFERVLQLQRQATVLVNPRTPKGEYTLYSFPSKTMEYLASGIPCIMYKLPGVPSEYYKYFYSPKEENSNGIKNAILEVCSKSEIELYDFGKAASEFILKNKNPQVQVKKIYDLINQ